MSDVFGTDASETINLLDGVSNGANSIWGFGGNDTIFGLGGADTIKGGGGADAIDGGNEIDTVDYTNSDTGVIVNLGLVWVQRHRRRRHLRQRRERDRFGWR